MARGATKRAKQVSAAKAGGAGTRRKPSRGARRQNASTYEEAMFFPKLRNHAKWVFLALAIVFALGFVVFGVGSGTGAFSLGDLINGSNNTGSGPSTSALEKQVQQNPKDAAAWRKLASAYEVKGDTPHAINALNRYTALKPKSAAAFQELAGLYGAKASKMTPAITTAQSQVSSVTPNPYLQPSATSPGTKKHPGQPIFSTPTIDSTLSAVYNTKLQQLQQTQRGFVSKAENAYQTQAQLQPRNAQLQLTLGQFAYKFGDIPQATLAFKRYLALAPHSQEASLVKKQLKILQASSQVAPVQPQAK